MAAVEDRGRVVDGTGKPADNCGGVDLLWIKIEQSNSSRIGYVPEKTVSTDCSSKTNQEERIRVRFVRLFVFVCVRLSNSIEKRRSIERL